MPVQDGAVLQLAVSTAASGLFQKDQLGPRHPSAKVEPTGETVLVWDGSTSVGSDAIRLAAAAGYEPAARSPGNEVAILCVKAVAHLRFWPALSASPALRRRRAAARRWTAPAT